MSGILKRSASDVLLGDKRAAAQKRIDFLLGMGIGLVVFILLYGVSTLNIAYDSWVYCGYIENDIVQFYAGWMFYRHAPWMMPITVANNLTIPYGASITFTDSVPLFAVVFKLFSPVLPATVQYFGWLNLTNFMLQGGFAMLLLRGFKLGRVFSAMASLLFVCAPVFVEKAYRHSSLGAQWLVLAALWLYFTARRSELFPAKGFITLCILSPAIHMYFLPMVYALFAAALLEYGFRTRQWLKAGIWLAASGAGVVIVSYLTGMLTRGGGGGASGFGRYSMNLNAMFNPTSFDWFAENDAMKWSALLPVRPQFYFQYEGFNYLGAGVLAALCIMAVYGLARLVLDMSRGGRAVLNRAASFIKGHVWLIAVCACLTAFSVSNAVYWDDILLFTVPLPGFVFRLSSIFRASGRMFWPCVYLLILIAVLGCGRLCRGKGRFAALSVLIALQLWDISPALVQKAQYFRQETLVREDDFTTEGWRFLMENNNTVLNLNYYVDYHLAAGIIRWNPNMRTNMILTNRGSFDAVLDSYLPMIMALREGQPVPEGTVYVCEDADTFNFIMEGAHPDARGYNTGKYYVIANPAPGCPLPEILPGGAA